MMIKVESSDGMVFELDQKAAEQSFFINETIQYCIEQVNTIKIPNINGKILSMIVNFCRKHAETVDFIELQSWDDEFIKDYNTDDIFDLISASDFLRIHSLMNLCCSKVAKLIEGKTASEIRDMLGIEYDFTEEEKEAIRKENMWAFS
ncbi:SKP1-like protein 9 [Dioscorea cayenensis subsp. rotundata]|uniref:SKP1-like protein n=1 Tax=Dioscorea cayennensis subsp. rotundata TaxID=55577 RepID=A0AB40C4G4_DIOCR|nr:SKP1-like protein 9 [Dioscorea cayenensis subsp. rotundata]